MPSQTPIHPSPITSPISKPHPDLNLLRIHLHHLYPLFPFLTSTPLLHHPLIHYLVRKLRISTVFYEFYAPVDGF